MTNMERQKHKTRAMIADDLAAHKRKMAYMDTWCFIAMVAFFLLIAFGLTFCFNI